MIIHSVQFDRPISGASLGDAPVPSRRALDADHQVADPPSLQAPDLSSIGPSNDTPSELAAIEKLLTDISTGIDNLNSQTGQWVDEIRTLSLRLAKMIVSRVVGSSESMRIERLEHLLREAMSRPKPPIAAFVHPNDFAKLTEHLKSETLNVQPEESVEAGECRVEFSSHELVSSLQRQMDQIEDRLMEVLNDA